MAAFTLPSVFTPFVMFRCLSLVSIERVVGDHFVVHISGLSSLMISLFCSPELNLTPVSSCMMLFVSANAGIDNSKRRRYWSFRPLSLVKPLLVFMLLIRTCSMTRLIDHFFLLREDSLDNRVVGEGVCHRLGLVGSFEKLSLWYG